jgi:hypothetical protein
MYTDMPLVPEPTSYEIKGAIKNLRSYKSAGIDQIPLKLIEREGNRPVFRA